MALETDEFVANLVTENLVEPMDWTSARLGAVSEFDFIGLEREAAVTVDAPRVAGAAACLECTVYDSMEVYDNVVTIGTVEHISIDERLTTDGVIDITTVDSVGRLGGPYYTRLDFLDVQRQNIEPGTIPSRRGSRSTKSRGGWKPSQSRFEQSGMLSADPMTANRSPTWLPRPRSTETNCRVATSDVTSISRGKPPTNELRPRLQKWGSDRSSPMERSVRPGSIEEVLHEHETWGRRWNA